MVNMIGRSKPLIDSEEKVTGQLKYGTDFKIPGMLYGKVLRSPIAHGKILNINTEKARSLPGVRAVLSGDKIDLPKFSVAGEKKFDERLLVKNKVHYCGDEVAIVAAVDEDTAEEALALIQVEYDELPGIFDLERALMHDSPLVHEEFGTNKAREFTINIGDINKAFIESDIIVEDKYETPRIHHGYLEPHAVVAQWNMGDRVTFWACTQTPILARMTYAKALGLGEEQIRIIQLPMGGGFGGKLEYKLHPLCALLSRETARPVKMVNTRKEELTASLPRMPMLMEMKLAARKDGLLLGKKTRILADNGAYLHYGPGILLSATTRHENLYRINNIYSKSFLVYTNRIPTGPMRGFGCPQSTFAFELLLDKLASEINMDPVELRLKNASQTGDTTSHQWYLGSCGLSDSINKAAAASRWSAKKSKKNIPEGSKIIRGIGIGCSLHVSGNRTFLPFFDGSSAFIRINQQGRVAVFSGEVDIGQGCKNVFAAIVSTELGIPIDWISVPHVDTDVNPLGLGTFGDRVTTLAGSAVKAAAIDARNQLLEAVAIEFNAKKEDVRLEEGFFYNTSEPGEKLSFTDCVKLLSYKQAGSAIIGRGSFTPPNVTMVHPTKKIGNVSCAYPFIAQIAEVEVNIETGEVKVINIFSAHDLGKVINPLMAKGQVSGAVAQGIGFALTEEIIEDQGIVKNSSFKHYNMPRAADMPSVTSIFVETNDPNGPYGAKGLAEPALTGIAPAIANAINDAICIHIKTLPITPEKILRALNESRSKEIE